MRGGFGPSFARKAPFETFQLARFPASWVREETG
jgi:hypothetical protein